MPAPKSKPTDIVFSPSQVSRLGTEYLMQRVENKSAGIPFGVDSIDAFFNPALPGDLISIIARPGGGKTSLMMWWARWRSQQLHKQQIFSRAVVYATYEQHVEDLHAFCVAADSHIDVGSMARGTLTNDEIDLVKYHGAHRVGQPLWFIGHSQERRARRPRLTIENLTEALYSIETWQEEGQKSFNIDMLFVDYLQRMPLPSGSESKGIGTDSLLNSLKDIGLQFACPVIVGVQARREVDNYAVPIPTLSDGQWCLAGDVEIMDAKTGLVKTVKEWCDNKNKLSVHSLSASSQSELTINDVDTIAESGYQDIYKLSTISSGHSIRTSGGHLFMTSYGWKRMDEIVPGDYVAFSRRLPIDIENELNSNRALLLGMMMGDGSYTNGHTPMYNCGNRPELCQLISEISQKEFSTGSNSGYNKPGQYHYVYMIGEQGQQKSNFLINWLRDIGIYGQYHNDASIPDIVMRSGNDCIAAFLRGLFTADGSSPIDDTFTSPSIYLSSASKVLIRQVQWLLLRFGIQSSIGTVYPSATRGKAKRPLYNLIMSGRENFLLFMSRIGFVGSKQDKAMKILHDCEEHRKICRSSNYLPPNISMSLINDVLSFGGMREKHNMVKGRCISYDRARKVAADIESDYWINVVEGDIVWKKVKSVERDGNEMTYDLVVPPDHNFIANGFVVHNTSAVEQVSDKIFSIVRPCKYKKEGEQFGSVIVQGHTQMFITLLKQKLGRDNVGRWVNFAPEYNQLNEAEERSVDLDDI